MEITWKKILTALSIVAAFGGALTAIGKYEEMNLPRPAMKSELRIVVAENLETKQMILEESIDRRQMQIYQNQRIQQEYELNDKPVPESLIREKLLLEDNTEKLEDQLEQVKEKRIQD